ncbi:MAG: hypothetical protein A2408_00095 [Candidatus Yonathbacteria bacterium RIFOXYC1_FULL_52_10]|uniref:Uncharacterized protein n=1 Tax=Candidatus Yonathbacteria bacterium RIFOXYD1_FULL_52_36 TaxID=1802730 RepID=A0A1G2SK81_9BACT|nr:MAG: hypothetical protein A2408_00095 [Candidatus Yonathbacteria bacterium RIFOXYC1_FULL_52_10]OHA85483.1 MAG: hypothetical protein A2591_01345 [Candidatus Yonathbacteria bacterium RIFOXYD1_FULL_52_36]
MNGNSKNGEREFDYLVGICRSGNATKGKPATFGIHGWSGWISLNHETKKEIIHLLPPSPSKKPIYHFQIDKFYRKNKRVCFGEQNGLADCIISREDRSTSPPRHKRTQRGDARNTHPSDQRKPDSFEIPMSAGSNAKH